MSAGDLREISLRREQCGNGQGELVDGLVLRVWVDDDNPDDPDDVLELEIRLPSQDVSGGWASTAVGDIIDAARRVWELE